MGPGPQPIPPSRQLGPGPEPNPPDPQGREGGQAPPAKTGPDAPTKEPDAKAPAQGPAAPSTRIVEQNIRNPNTSVGSNQPWNGRGPEPSWSNPKSTKAYDHIESTHGPKLKPANFKGRLASGARSQGQWSNAQDWVAAEQAAPKYQGEYIVDFGRPIGRVYNADGTVTEDVTRAFVQRNADGTLNSSYPVDNNFTLR